MRNRVQTGKRAASRNSPLALGIGALAIACSATAQLPATIDLSQPVGSEGAPVTRIYGDTNSGIGYGTTSGSSLQNQYGGGAAYGDFNGDGYDDLAIGAPRAQVPVNPINGPAGSVYLLFGSADGVPQEMDLSITPIGPKVARIFGDDTGVQLGRSLASGDFNNDGYDDIVMGAMSYAPGTAPCTSAYPLYILYGSANLPGQTIYLPSETELLADGVPSYLSIICTGESLDYTGVTLAVGDFDGDGLDDVIAGSNNNRSVVLFGATLNVGAYTVLAENSGTYTVIGGGIWIGFDVGSGDINGDGFDDIILGEQRSGTGTHAWEVYIVYGHDGLWPSDYGQNSIPTRILGETLPWPYDGDGYSFVDAGDIDGDGRDDVVVTSAAGNVRRMTIVYGVDIVGNAVVDLALVGQGTLSTRYTDYSHVSDSVQPPYHAAVGDVNGDGRADIVLGVASYSYPTPWQSGRAYMVFGGATLHGANVDLDATGGDVRLVSASTGFDFFGSSPGAGGDTNGDGFADFTVSAPLGVTASTNTGGGYAVQVYGAGNAMSATATEGFRAGDAPSRGFGGRLSPVLRTHLAFNGGDTALATATLTRHVNNITNFPDPVMLADVSWELSTTRTGWSSAEVTFHYLEHEVAGLLEDDLTLYHASTPAGPWTKVTTQQLNTHRNEITATLNSFSHFVIAQKGTTGMPASRFGTLAALVGVLVLLGAVSARRRFALPE